MKKGMDDFKMVFQFVNRKTVSFVLGICWILPVLFGLVGAYESPHPSNLCNPSHAGNKLPTILSKIQACLMKLK